MTQADIDGILDAIEQPNFLDSTFIASGHGTVAQIIGGMPEIKTLVENKGASLPVMRSRYLEQDARMTDSTRLVYLVVFGLTHDREMIEAISAYLERARALPTSTLYSPWHPFLHGMRALEEITGGEVQAPASADSVRQLDDFIKRVSRWDQTHTDPSHREN